MNGEEEVKGPDDELLLTVATCREISSSYPPPPPFSETSPLFYALPHTPTPTKPYSIQPSRTSLLFHSVFSSPLFLSESHFSALVVGFSPLLHLPPPPHAILRYKTRPRLFLTNTASVFSPHLFGRIDGLGSIMRLKRG